MAASLFRPGEIKAAQERLEASGFPLSTAEDWRRLDAPEPFSVYTVAASEALRALQDPEDERRSVKAARRTADLVDRITKWVNDSLSGPPKPVKVACRAGCHLCCFIRVNALPAEVESLLEFVEAKFSASDRQALRERVDAFVQVAAPLTPGLRFAKPMLCPLNVGGLCTVYDVRPMACRAHHSFSVAECEVSFQRWEENLTVTRSAMRKVCSEAAMEGLMDALAFVGLDGRVLELPEALQIGLGGSRAFDAAFRPEIVG